MTITTTPAPAYPVPLAAALSTQALLALWHRRNLEAAQAQAATVSEALALGWFA